MGNEEKYLKELARRYKAGLCTAEETELIRQWYEEFDHNGYALPAEEEIDRASMEAAKAVMLLVEQQELVKGEKRENGKKLNRQQFIRFAVAATVLISCFTAYLFQRHVKQPDHLVYSNPQQISPGGNKAILTLNNGQKIMLDSAVRGNVAQQGYTVITKTGNGLISYLKGGSGTKRDAAPLAMNTITTPRGGEYQVTLPDGTHVWLNSESSIRFPVAFNGKQRKVETTGEVYFEVIKNKDLPFLVETKGQIITVLGTHFNVMAYPDEPHLVTTLLEGSIKIMKGSESRVLVPGEQAQIDEHIEVAAADVEDAVAWKNGITSFTDADIKSIMRRISRWYNVDVIYKGSISDRKFTGAISRSSNLSGLVKILALNRIRLAVEGNKLILDNSK